MPELGRSPYLVGTAGELLYVSPSPVGGSDSLPAETGRRSSRDDSPINPTLAKWISEISHVEIVVGAPALDNPTPVQRPTERMLKQYPGRHWNSISIPWTASLPGHAILLLTSDQLEYLEETPNDALTLTLNAYRQSGGGEALIETIVLTDWYLDRAFPLIGQHVGDIQTEYREGDTTDPGEAPSEFEEGAVWEVHLKDKRALAGLRIVDQLLNIYDPTTRRYFRDTCRAIGPNARPWTWNEVVNAVFLACGLGSTPSLSNLPENYTPKNMAFRGVPATIALDIVLSRAGLVYRPDYRSGGESTITPWLGWSGTTNYGTLLATKINELKQLRITGSTWRRYARPNVPYKARVFSTNIRESGWYAPDPGSAYVSFTHSYLDEDVYYVAPEGSTPSTSSQVPMHTQEAAIDWEQDADVTYDVAQRHTQQYGALPGQHVFHGWITDFLEEGGWSLIVFSMDGGGAPRTYVEQAAEPPMGAVQRHRFDLLKQGLPVPVAFTQNGITVWQMSSEGAINVRSQPLFFLGRVMERDTSSNTLGGNQRGTVKPIIAEDDAWISNPFSAPVDADDGQAINGVYLWHESWIIKDDPVLCFYTGLKNPRWVAINIPPVRIANKFCEPEANCLCEEAGEECDPCTTSPVSTDPQVELPED